MNLMLDSAFCLYLPIIVNIEMAAFIRYTVLICICALLPFVAHAKEKEVDTYAGMPAVSDSILSSIFQFSSLYSKVIDEYKAEMYMKGRLKVHKSNRLIRYIPSMFRLEKGVNEYMIESVSEMHYTAPDIYNRKVKAVSTTFPRLKGQLTDLTDFLNMNMYSSSMMSDKLLSPLDKESSRYYNYLLDSIIGPSDNLVYKIQIVPKYKGTQLVNGYILVSDQIWSIREIYMEGQFDMIQFKLRRVMGEAGEEEFLPVHFDLNLTFKFMGNHLEMTNCGQMKYTHVSLYNGGNRRKSQKKHFHDLTEFYTLTFDSTQVITDKAKFAQLRPYPLLADEDSLYRNFKLRQDTLLLNKQQETDSKTKSSVFWGQVGDMLIGSYNVNLAGMGSVKCSPLINPVMLSYSHSRGVSYKQRFKYNKLFNDGRLLRITPQIGFNFTRKELYVKADAQYQYWPQKLGSLDVSVGNGNRIFSSVVLDKLKEQPDSTFNFNNVELDYFKDVYLNVFHSVEPVNGLLIKAGVSMHWRYLGVDLSPKVEGTLSYADILKTKGIRSEYNSFAPRLRIEWTPGLYYYMNGNRKMNIRSKMPTFILDYERGMKGVLGSSDGHERFEFDVRQIIKLSRIRSLAYRVGGGMFTRMDNMYFVDFVNFSRSNIPEDWNDEIGGTFQLLDRRWFNSSSQYWRGHVTYESPFILLRPLNRLLGEIHHERLYGGILFMPHLNPYVELGYGIGTHIFDVGAFVSSINGEFDTVGFKFTFELFND